MLLVSTSGCAAAGRYEDPWLAKGDVASLQANPSQMNDSIVMGTNLDGLRLENVTIRNTAFVQTTGRGVVLKNVVFDNCRFINATFTQATLENVTFRGGLMTCKTNADNIAERTSFINSVFKGVRLEGTALDNVRFDLRDSQITLKNLYSNRSLEPMITGSNVQITLDAAILRFMTIAQVSGASTLSAQRCTFEHVDFGTSVFASAQVAGCVTYGPSVMPHVAERR